MFQPVSFYMLKIRIEKENNESFNFYDFFSNSTILIQANKKFLLCNVNFFKEPYKFILLNSSVLHNLIFY